RPSRLWMRRTVPCRWRGRSHPHRDSHKPISLVRHRTSFPARQQWRAVFVVATSGLSTPRFLQLKWYARTAYGGFVFCIRNVTIPPLESCAAAGQRVRKAEGLESRLVRLRLLGASIGWRNSWPNRHRMCNWALRFRTGFRPFSFSHQTSNSSITLVRPASPQVRGNPLPESLVTLLGESGHTAGGRNLLSVTTW